MTDTTDINPEMFSVPGWKLDEMTNDIKLLKEENQRLRDEKEARMNEKLDDPIQSVNPIHDSMNVTSMMQFFTYDHLPLPLQEVSSLFATLAHWMIVNLPANPERTVALRKLLESKDSAVRARLFK